MKLFEVKYEKPEDGDLFGISIVESPANSFQFIAMDKKVKIKLAEDKKKQILYGIVLRPEQLIYREFEDGTPFNLKFSKETIEILSQDYLQKGYQHNSTFDHKGNMLDGACVVEQWIVHDKDNDKGNSLGLPVEDGDWIIGMKLSDKLWKEYIETGKAKGFSIDSFLDLKKVSMSITNNKEQKNKKMSLLKRLIKMFSEEEGNVVSISIEGMGELFADAFEVGNVVYKDVEGVMEPLVSSSFVHEGFIYTTDENGIISEKLEDKSMEDVEMEDVSPELQEEIFDVVSDIVEEVSNPIEEVDVEVLKSKIAELEKQIEILTKNKETIISENVEMRKKLSTKPNSTKLKANAVTMTKQSSTMSVLRQVIEAGQKNK